MEAAFHIVPFEFADLNLDESFISNAQEFARYVTRAFPRGDDVVAEYRRYTETTLSKLDEIYNGTSSYLNTLIRKGENHRIPQVVESQMQEAIKILEQGNNLIDIYKIMKNYLDTHL